MKILLTGGSGMLGKALAMAARETGFLCDSLSRASVNLGKPNELIPLIADYDLLIHAAANTNVEQCERDPVACYRDNAFLTEVLASAAANTDVKMVYISSTGVYGSGKDSPYHEYDETVPLTHHHKSKLLGEAFVGKCRSSLIIRTGWLFGGSAENPKNFVAARLREAALSHGPILSDSEQRGNPTSVRDLAGRIFLLIRNDQSGVFNCVNEGVASRFDYVRAILSYAGNATHVEPTRSASFNRVAKVSNNESAINMKMNCAGFGHMPEWRESLSEYIYEIKR
jgi:dTDP-4-dehydrorhamnose reductase